MKPVIGITMGDPAGIGSEITVKALACKEIYEACIPVVIGDRQALLEANDFSNTNLELHAIKDVSEAQGKFGVLDYIDPGLLDSGSFTYGKVQQLCGEASFQYIVRAIGLAMEKKLHAVVTGPISKEAVNLAGHHYSGHTEIFADYTDTTHYGMLLMSKTLKVIHVTTHCSLRDACDRITKERVLDTVRLAQEGMRMLGFQNPKIGVAGLNPHCSENGLFGFEEERAILPAVEEAKRLGLNVEGPVPPDTVFVKAQAGQYDIVVAMYHDQGHIPLKFSCFQLDSATNGQVAVSGVNCTVGLPIIRTSVDHGTAFDRAGGGNASAESLTDAIDAGIVMAKSKFNL